MPQQLTTDNILEYKNLPKKDFSKNINIVYTINSVDNTNGSANITMNVIEGTDNIAISNIEISGFRTYAEQLNLNSNLFSNLELQGNDKLVPALLTEENI